METEVKLAFKNRESLYQAAASGWFTEHCLNPDSTPMTLENYYLDTRDLVLGLRQAAFRKRHCKGINADFYEFTVKCRGGANGGIHKRYEWNVKSNDGVLSVDEFKMKAGNDGDDPEILAEVLDGIKDSDLFTLCSNSFDRTMYDFRFGNSTMEACIDYGEIKDSQGKVCDIICEMELELKDGSLEDLEASKIFIMSKTDAVPFDLSKFKRTLDASRSGGNV